MGYTHYFAIDYRMTNSQLEKITKEIEIICKLNEKYGISLYTYSNYMTIKYNKEEILILNFNNQLNYEQRYLKTNRAEYDLCICMIILSLANNLYNFSFETNGSIVEWQKPIDLYIEHIGQLKLNKEKHIIKDYDYENKIIISI